MIHYCLIFLGILRSTYQQDSGGDGSDNGNSDTNTESCSFISGQNCGNNGVCKYCAMCLQSSCILGKYMPSNRTIGNPVCDATRFGMANVYDWYGYCLSSGNDNSGEYCATRTHCYQYLRNDNTSTTYVWRNLTCDPQRCILVTDNGQPAPTPGALPPIDDPSATNHHHSPTYSIPPHSAEEHNPTVIALSVSCTLIFVGVLLWFMRLWKHSSHWPPSCLKQLKTTGYLSSSTSAISYPYSAPPSFSSTTTEMIGRQQQQQIQRSSLSPSTRSSISSNNRFGEPLPSYFSRGPPPPKYQHAIVTQIRGLLEDSNYHYQAGASSSRSAMNHDDYDESMTLDYHDDALPPPMWVPIYFAPNRNSFSLGRLRRHPQHHQPSTEDNINTCHGHYSRSSSSSSTLPTTDERDLGSSSAIQSSISTTASTPQS